MNCFDDLPECFCKHITVWDAFVQELHQKYGIVGRLIVLQSRLFDLKERELIVSDNFQFMYNFTNQEMQLYIHISKKKFKLTSLYFEYLVDCSYHLLPRVDILMSSVNIASDWIRVVSPLSFSVRTLNLCTSHKLAGTHQQLAEGVYEGRLFHFIYR